MDDDDDDIFLGLRPVTKIGLMNFIDVTKYIDSSSRLVKNFSAKQATKT